MNETSLSSTSLTEKHIENQLSRLFLQAPIGFALVKGDTHLMELANTEFLRLTGRSTDIIGKPITEIFPEFESQGYLDLLDNVLKHKHTIQLKENPAVILIDGTRETLFVNTVLQPYYEGEQVIGVLSILTDVTEQVLARKKIEDSEQRLRLATETTNLGTWEFIPSTGQLTWSDECKRIYQFPLNKEVDYALFSEHIFPDDKNFAEGSIQEAMDPKGSGEYNIEYRIMRFSDKSVRWIKAQGKVYFDEEKKPLRFIGTVLDITERKLAEDALWQAKNESERRKRLYEAVTGSTPDLIYVFNLNYRFTYANEALLNMWGRSWQDSIGKGLLELGYEPWHAEMHEKEIDQVVATKLPIRGEVSFPHAELGRRVYDYIFTPVLNEKGEVEAVAGTTRDITEQKETERILKESQDKMRLITDAVPHMVWEIELDGTISYINKQWEDWSGLSLEEINQGGWSKVFHPEDADKVAIGWAEAFADKNIYTGECRIKTPQGGYSWFTLKTVPVKNNKDEVELWIGTATDIHDKKIAEHQKDEFLSIASHELKTPVTSLKGFTQILQMKFENEGNDTAVDLLSKIDRQVNKLTKLIIDLLDVTKIENGQLQLTNEEFDFNALVTEIVEEMQRTTDNQHILTTLAATKIINGDKNRIGQVITNLVSNAIKYSPNGDKVIISTTINDNHIKLGVQDFGIGISSEKQPLVFDRFFRVNGNAQETYPGLGLGLFISKEIIKRHNGEISVDSIEGEGSIFSFTLPL